FTLTELWSHMGVFAKFIAIILGIMSLTSLLVMFERLFMFMRSNGDSKTFAAKVGAILAKGELDAAAGQKLDGKRIGHLARVIQSGLAAFTISPKENKDVAVESVARALDRQSQREVHSLKRGLGWLPTVGSTAPFVGRL